MDKLADKLMQRSWRAMGSKKVYLAYNDLQVRAGPGPHIRSKLLPMVEAWSEDDSDPTAGGDFIYEPRRQQ